MNTRTTLADALAGTRAELAQQAPPPELLQRLLVAAPTAPPRQPALRLAAWFWPAGLACTAVLVGSVVLMLQAPVLQPQQDELRPLRMSGFVPLAAAERWPDDAAPAWLVSTELRQDRLALLGLPFDPARAGETVRAELLMRASGEVLAVRLAP